MACPGKIKFTGEDVYCFHLAEGLPYVENLKVTSAVRRATLDRAYGPAAGRLARTEAHRRR